MDCLAPQDAFSSRLAPLHQLFSTVPVVALDLETTGLSCQSERVISIANEEEAQTDTFLHAWLLQFGTDWISAKTLVGEIEKWTDENQTSANRLAENLPDDLVFKLKEKPKTFTLILTKWLERRVKTPYGRDNIRIEKDFDKHTRSHLNTTEQFAEVCGGLRSVCLRGLHIVSRNEPPLV